MLCHFSGAPLSSSLLNHAVAMLSSDPFSSFQCHCHCLAPILAPLLPDTQPPTSSRFLQTGLSLSPMAARQRYFLSKRKSAHKGSTPTNICGKPVYTNTIWFLQTEIQDGLWSRFEHSALVFHSGSNFLPHPILRMLLSSNDCPCCRCPYRNTPFLCVPWCPISQEHSLCKYTEFYWCRFIFMTATSM